MSWGSGKTRFAEDAHLGVGQWQVLELEGQDFTGTQTIEQHQT
jgi:hypothetical protein